MRRVPLVSPRPGILVAFHLVVCERLDAVASWLGAQVRGSCKYPPAQGLLLYLRYHWDRQSGQPCALNIAAPLDSSFDGAAAAAGFAGAGAGKDDAEAGGVAAVAVDVPPRLVIYVTSAPISTAIKVSGTISAAFILALGAFKSAVNLAGGY